MLFPGACAGFSAPGMILVPVKNFIFAKNGNRYSAGSLRECPENASRRQFLRDPCGSRETPVRLVRETGLSHVRHRSPGKRESLAATPAPCGIWQILVFVKKVVMLN